MMLILNNHNKTVTLMISTILASGAWGNTALAAVSEEESFGEESFGEDVGAGFSLEEIVVTAQKREQNLQETPVSLAAFDRMALEAQVIRDISDVSALTPNLQIAPSPGGTTGATVAIRGSAMINPAVTWEPAVGIYFDGVFVAKNVGGLFDVAELERIEVLRGPQGALYGKNTTGGAINLITRRPAGEFSGSVHGGLGNFGYYEFGGTLDTARLGDLLSLSFSYKKRERDGLYDNVPSSLPFANPPVIDEFNRLDSEAARVAALFELSENLELYYTFDWARRDNTPAFGQFEVGTFNDSGELIGPAETKRLKEGSLDGTLFDRSKSLGHAVHVTWDISDTVTFKSISAYREMEFNDSNDYDGVPFTGFHTIRDVEHSQTSQEFQLVGNGESLSYVLGLFYFNEKADAVNPFDFGFGVPIRNFYGVESTSYAAFGQVDWTISEKWTVSFGARWTTEEKDSFVRHPDGALIGAPTFDVEANASWDNFSPMATVSYKIDDDVNAYARVARGWKAGGFNGEPTTAEEAQKPYDEETLTSYEIGLKARWLGGRLQTNIAAFYNTVEDMQLSSFLGAYSFIENAGEATVKGVEFEGVLAVTESLTAFLNYGYMKGDYQDFSSGGVQKKDIAKFPYMPENKVSVGLEHVVNLGFGELHSRLDYSWTDEQFFYHEVDQALLSKSEAYDVLNARIALMVPFNDRQEIEVSVWGKNLTDSEYRLNGIPIASAGYSINYYGDPRTYGVAAKFTF